MLKGEMINSGTFTYEILYSRENEQIMDLHFNILNFSKTIECEKSFHRRISTVKLFLCKVQNLTQVYVCRYIETHPLYAIYTNIHTVTHKHTKL